MAKHHIMVKIKLGCGCTYEQRMELQDDEEPSGELCLTALMEALMNPELANELLVAKHEGHGDEKIDIEIRTKVGEIRWPS